MIYISEQVRDLMIILEYDDKNVCLSLSFYLSVFPTLKDCLFCADERETERETERDRERERERERKEKRNQFSCSRNRK